MQYTRQQYLDRECTFEQYYAQFVTDGIKLLVVNRFGIDKLAIGMNYDDQKHYIQLSHWDMLANHLPNRQINDKMRPLGDYLTLSGKVCILKTAARLALKERGHA